jgi:hypothetical protein
MVFFHATFAQGARGMSRLPEPAGAARSRPEPAQETKKIPDRAINPIRNLFFGAANARTN